jgi:hypothetical protein
MPVEEYRMGSILVRGLDQKTIARLKERARSSGARFSRR